MAIFERLGKVVQSYLNDITNEAEYKKGRRKTRQRSSGADPDLEAAYDELDDFLSGSSSRKSKAEEPAPRPREEVKKPRPIPKEVQEDLAELGLGPEASAEECKEAYKRLLKIHHPDRHSRHEQNMKKATEKTMRVNAAYERLEKWYNLQK